MPTFRQGNMWTAFEKVDHFVFTTNSTIRTDGSLVMGAGIAKQVRDMFPNLAQEFGAIVRGRCESGGVYGLILVGRFGLLQTKRHWHNDSDPQLVMYSVNELAKIARQFPDRVFAVNYPGIGKGNLSKEQVRPMLNLLPDNVQVWEYSRADITPNNTQYRHKPRGHNELITRARATH